MPGASFEGVIEKIKQHKSGLLDEKRYRKNAVLVPLVYTAEKKLAVLFTKRASTLRRQSGEICFPGGHFEENDENYWATAQRETHEELQVPLSSIEYVGELDVLVAPSQMIVYPFVGLIHHSEPFQPNPAEVDEVFTVELDRLLQMEPARHEVVIKVQPEADFPFHLIPNGENYNWRTGRVPQTFYDIDGRIIWGLTARILTHFLDLIRFD